MIGAIYLKTVSDQRKACSHSPGHLRSYEVTVMRKFSSTSVNKFSKTQNVYSHKGKKESTGSLSIVNGHVAQPGSTLWQVKLTQHTDAAVPLNRERAGQQQISVAGSDFTLTCVPARPHCSATLTVTTEIQ